MRIKAKFIDHKGEQRIAVYFDRDIGLINRFKKLKGAQWSSSLKVWHLPNNTTYRHQFNLQPLVNTRNPATEKAICELKSWLLSKRYSASTIQTYLNALKIFLTFFKDKDPCEIKNSDVVKFNNDYIIKNKLSISYQNQMINAIKLFFRQLQGKQIVVDLIDRPRRENKLPNVLSKQEVKAILEAHHNIKHKAMLSLTYACGLRRGELLHLRLTDVDSKRGVLIIRQAKGKKDRIAPLSSKILDVLRLYYKSFKPKKWLFEGAAQNAQYSEKSLQSVLKQALQKAGNHKPVSLHWLRHSYATHLLENGTDLRYIQELLGHKSSRTTEIYTHISTKSLQQIKSPFDDL